MMKSLLITAEHRFFPGSDSPAGKLKNAANSAALWALKKTARRLSKQQGPLAGLTSHAFNACLPEKAREGLETYGRNHSKFAALQSYPELYAFADALHELAMKMGESSGLVTCSTSVFKILETRWSSYVHLNYLAYALMIADAFKKNPGAKIQLTDGFSFCERFAEALALKEGRTVATTLTPLTAFLGGYECLEERTKLPFFSMTDYHLRYARHTPPFAEIDPPQVKRLLFVAFKERTIRRIKALLPALREKGMTDIVALGVQPHGEDLLSSDGIKTLHLTDFVLREEIDFWFHDHARKTRFCAPEFFEAFPRLDVEGVNLSPFLKPLFHSILDEGAGVAAFYANSAERAVAAIKPSTIVHFEEWEINRAVTLSARKSGNRKIPTFAYYCLSPDFNGAAARRLPDRLLSSGKALAELHQRAGFWPADKIMVVGDPLSAPQKRKATQASREKPQILLITNYSDAWISNAQLMALFKSVQESAKALECELIVKCHPQQPVSDVEKIFKTFHAQAGSVKIVGAGDLSALAAQADVAVMFLTTAASQVLGANTPLVSIQPAEVQSEIERLYRYRADAGIPVITLGHGDELTAELRKILNDPAYRNALVSSATKYLEIHSGPQDGRAAERFIAALETNA